MDSCIGVNSNSDDGGVVERDPTGRYLRVCNWNFALIFFNIGIANSN